MSKSGAREKVFDELISETPVNEMTEISGESAQRVSFMANEMCGLIQEESESPIEALQAISAVVSMVICNQVENKASAERLNDLFNDVIKRTIAATDKSGDALWNRLSWN